MRQPGDADQGERDMRWHCPEDAITVVDEGKLKVLSEAFASSFTLPWQVDQQNITAHLEDGVQTLTLTLNKRPESKPRRIPIQ